MTVEVYGDIEAVAKRARRVAAPVKVVPTYAELALQMRFPDGPKKGLPYDVRNDPIHAAAVGELDCGFYSRFVPVGAVQTGKSLILHLIAFRGVTYEHIDVVYSMPTMPKIHEAWTGKMRPLLMSGGLKGWMPIKGQGSRGSETPPFVQFSDPSTGSRSGILYFIPGGGSKESGQAAVTAKKVIVDEVDSYTTRHRVDLVSKRADSYRRKAFRSFTSTVKRDQNSIILGMYDDSTGSRLQFPCPHCGYYQSLEWENVRYEREDPEQTVQYYCQCGMGWTEGDRTSALRKWRLVHRGQTVDRLGVVSGVPPRTDTFGFLWTSLDSTLRDLGFLAAEHLRALKQLEAGDHGPMRSFYRDQLCRMYVGEMEEMESNGVLTWQALASRANKERGFGPALARSDRQSEAPDFYLYSGHYSEPPSEASWSVGAIDVQGNRVYSMLRAFNRDESSWIYWWGYRYARKDHAAADAQELRALLRTTCLELGRMAPAHAPVIHIGVDVGDQTELIRSWVETEKGKCGPVRCMKGYTHHLKAEAQDVEGLCYFRDGLFLVLDGPCRNMFQSTLRRPIDAPGATHLPRGLGIQNKSILQHLVSEQEGLDPKTKKLIVIRGAGRNDWLDCGKITQALIVGTLFDMKIHEPRDEHKPFVAQVPTVADPDDADPVKQVRIRSALQNDTPMRNPVEYRAPRRYGGVGFTRRR